MNVSLPIGEFALIVFAVSKLTEFASAKGPLVLPI
jgi:hypothetical protein